MNVNVLPILNCFPLETRCNLVIKLKSMSPMIYLFSFPTITFRKYYKNILIYAMIPRTVYDITLFLFGMKKVCYVIYIINCILPYILQIYTSFSSYFLKFNHSFLSEFTDDFNIFYLTYSLLIYT